MPTLRFQCYHKKDDAKTLSFETRFLKPHRCRSYRVKTQSKTKGAVEMWRRSTPSRNKYVKPKIRR